MFAPTTINQRGASLLEFAMVLPLILSGCMILMWLGLTLHADVSLQTALQRSLRLATTRGASDVVGQEIFGDVAAFAASGNAPMQLRELLTSGGVDWADAQTTYNTWSNTVFGANLDLLPESYTYFYIYMAEAVRQSMGSSVRFPCPASPAADPLSGAGCVECFPLNPTTDATSGDYLTTNLFADEVPERALAFQCRYQPPLMLLRPIMSLLSFFSGPSNVPVLVLESRGAYDAG